MRRSPALLPMRTVARVTGMNPITLRAWENRYSLIKPDRTEKGHRLYSETDVERIYAIKEWVSKGVAVSQVGHLLGGAAPAEQVSTEPVPVWGEYIEGMLEAIAHFDTEALDRIYHEVLSLYSIQQLTDHIVLPLSQCLGQRWQYSQAGIAEEHFFSVYLRNKIGARLQHIHPHHSGPTLVLACLPKDAHENALLLFGLCLIDHGFRIIVLGADMVLHELLLVMQKTNAKGLILSGILTERAKQQLEDCFSQVRWPVCVYLREGSVELQKRFVALDSDYEQAVKQIKCYI